jgi:N-carbamoylputrescine amidase
MTRPVTVAATQMACGSDASGNVEAAVELVRQAAAEDAQIVLLQELFETPYFCRTQRAEHFGLARPLADHPVIERFAALAAELGVVVAG